LPPGGVVSLNQNAFPSTDILSPIMGEVAALINLLVPFRPKLSTWQLPRTGFFPKSVRMLQLETGKILIRPILELQSSSLIVASIVELVSMWRLQSCGLQLDECRVYHGEP